MKLFKAMATVASLTAVSRVLGFLRDILTAAVLGAGPLADAFVVALRLPNLFRRITAEGAFSVSFIPLYSDAMEKEGRKAADDFAGNAMVIMFWGLLVFTIFIMLFMPQVIALIAPGFDHDSERFSMAVTLSRITFPYLLMMSVAALLGGVLNAHGRFVPFAAAPVLFNLALIGVLLVAWKFKTAAHALAYGVLIAGVLQFVFLYMYIKREKIRIPLLRPRFDVRTKKLFKLMGPGAIGAGVIQINIFTDMIIASFLPIGSVSYLYYADRLNQLPLSTVGIAVGTALLPMLSRAVGAGNKEEAKFLFNRALEVTLFLGIPAALALIVIADPIMTVLFVRGKFTADAAHYTALVLQGYSVGLPAYIAVKVFSTAFWSRQDTTTPVKVSVIVTLANIAIALTLVQFIGIAGIALATGLVGWAQVWFLAKPLRGGDMSFDDRFRRVLPRIFLSGIIMSAALYGGMKLIGGYSILSLSGLVALGIVAYALAVLGTGAIKMSEIKSYFRKPDVRDIPAVAQATEMGSQGM